eukprot:GFUD01020154.1.p1 GENE.GFUD01020154.1~~GFUD01020154.1.p1  ORF type:complete len:460 (+),score=117.03 GFUD01020154.1:43-1422(+)
MALKLKDTNTLTYPDNIMKWEEDIDPGSDEAQGLSADGMKKKRRPANLCIECPVCGGPAPDHLHFGGQSCYSCRAFFRRTSPRPISSFRCRSGQNNCIINSGSKSCIPCRLTKCLQIGMDPSLVRGKKYKSDSDSEETTNNFEEEYPKYQSVSTVIPPLTPIIKSKSTEGPQESILKFRAEVLKYQGMCLQYQASLLEKQAKSMTIQQTNQYQEMKYSPKLVDHEQKYYSKTSEPSMADPKYNPNMVGPKYNPNMAAPEPRYISKSGDYEPACPAYPPPMAAYTQKESLLAEYEEARYKQFDSERYSAQSISPIDYSDMDHPRLPNPAIVKPKFQGSMYSHHRNTDLPRSCTERERSPLRTSSTEMYPKLPPYGQPLSPHHEMFSHQINPERQPYSPQTPEGDVYSQHHPEHPLMMEEDGSGSPGPMDLSLRKSCQSPQLHTQALNMPRIFFRLEPTRI